MEAISYKKGRFLPNLGIAGASFAAFLQILAMVDPPDLAIKAVEDFSSGIPMIIACFFLPSIRNTSSLFLFILGYFLLLINSIFVIFGNLLCLQGLYKCFLLVSPVAAQNFQSIGIFIFILVFIGGVYELIEEMIETKLVRKLVKVFSGKSSS